MEPAFHYSERPCPPALRPWLWSYWEFRVESDGAAVPHHVPPDGSTSVAVVVASGQVVHVGASGPWLEPFVVPVVPTCQYWGVRCRPESGGLVLGVSPEKLRDRSQPIDHLAPGLAQGLREAMAQAGDFDQAVAAMDRVFAGHLHGVDPPDPLARDAVNRLIARRGEAAIAALAEELHVAPRTLLRRFRGATGLNPKQFARICRFRYAALTLLEADPPGWARIATESGFADQAHMINEFKDLTGLTPETLGQRVRSTSHGKLHS